MLSTPPTIASAARLRRSIPAASNTPTNACAALHDRRERRHVGIEFRLEPHLTLPDWRRPGWVSPRPRPRNRSVHSTVLPWPARPAPTMPMNRGVQMLRRHRGTACGHQRQAKSIIRYSPLCPCITLRARTGASASVTHDARGTTSRAVRICTTSFALGARLAAHGCHATIDRAA